MTEDETVGWYHWLNGHEFEQALGDGEGQGRLVCCSPWGRTESDMTEWLNNKYISHPAQCLAHWRGTKWGSDGGVIVRVIIMGGELQVILDLLWCPVARTSPSNAGVVGSVLGWGTKIPHAAWCGQKNKQLTKMCLINGSSYNDDDICSKALCMQCVYSKTAPSSESL